MHSCFAMEPPRRVVVSPKVFDSLMIFSTLKMMGAITDGEMARRCKAVCPELQYYMRHELVVDWAMS